MKREPEVDLVSYDYILATILKSSNADRRKFDIAHFLQLSVKRKLTPTKEQLCMLVD